MICYQFGMAKTERREYVNVGECVLYKALCTNRKRNKRAVWSISNHPTLLLCLLVNHEYFLFAIIGATDNGSSISNLSNL